MARWPEYFMVAESPAGDLMGYIMGKSEGLNENWHGHVTAVSDDEQRDDKENSKYEYVNNKNTRQQQTTRKQ